MKQWVTADWEMAEFMVAMGFSVSLERGFEDMRPAGEFEQEEWI